MRDYLALSAEIVNVHTVGPSEAFSSFPMEKVLQIMSEDIPCSTFCEAGNCEQLKRPFIGPRLNWDPRVLWNPLL